MNKSQLIDALSDRFEGSRKDAAHALKGMIGVFSKGQAFMAVRDLDAAAKLDDFSCAAPLCRQLQAGAVALRQDLESMLRQWESSFLVFVVVDRQTLLIVNKMKFA